MRILISGICGFVGSTLARALAEPGSGHTIVGFDNFIRPGSETNRAGLTKLGVKIFHGDLRAASDLAPLPPADWVIDAAANPSVLAGIDGRTSSRQLVEHNLSGTVNLLEFCKQHRAGFILLSTSRVYSIAPLVALPVEVNDGAFRPNEAAELPRGMGAAGVRETFSTLAPVSLYGATKLASEALALEYGEAFDHGHQVRDCLHPRDLAPLLAKQFAAPRVETADRIANFSGGTHSARSLRQLSDWCAANLGPHAVGVDPTPRQFDIPWLVLDSAKASRVWGWQPQTPVVAILDEIAAHARAHPAWLDLSAPF
jgi:CDP-paratose 2-epimerase